MTPDPIDEQGAVRDAFSLLAPGIQRQLWRMGWTQLRPIQVDAIHAILGAEQDLLIPADTAAGKTEAAFLPILSRISSDPIGSIRAMYVGPLRALINDQFRRVEDLCGYLEMPVHRWHGDVGAAAKRALLARPGGVLLITPESLESLFVNRSAHLKKLFSGLRFVVIDELHAFLGNERGLHLRSLLARLRHSPAAGKPSYRVVGLSATIGDMSAAQRFLAPDEPSSVMVLSTPSDPKELRYRLHAYTASSESASLHAPYQSEREPDSELLMMGKVAADLVEHCRGGVNLVFANAKGDIEVFADLCREIAARDRLPGAFLVHHGSLSKEIREDTEAQLKTGRAQTAFCSSTLELGIDIGQVRMVGQVGAPWSVSSFKQRIGRSGRKDGDPRIARVYVTCRELGPDADLVEKVHCDLLQAIAVTEHLLNNWVEPTDLPLWDLSTLTHQVISLIAETGGLSAEQIFVRLCKQGPFREVTPGVFARLLKALGAGDVIEQARETLILGLEGERIRTERDFYAAFQTPEEFSVVHDNRSIGMLPVLALPNEGDHLLLAAKRWQVEAVDTQRSEIRVARARGRKRPAFVGRAGEVHNEIRARMRSILTDSEEPTYLCQTAARLLAEGRETAEDAQLLRRSLVPVSDQRTLWFTWAGTRVQTTLRAILATHDLQATDREVAIQLEAPLDTAMSVIRKIAHNPINATEVAACVQPKSRRKFDHLLTDDLLVEAIAESVIDIRGAVAKCQATVG